MVSFAAMLQHGKPRHVPNPVFLFDIVVGIYLAFIHGLTATRTEVVVFTQTVNISKQSVKHGVGIDALTAPLSAPCAPLEPIENAVWLPAG